MTTFSDNTQAAGTGGQRARFDAIVSGTSENL